MSRHARRIYGQLTRLHCERTRKRENDSHQHGRKLADTVVVEDLDTKAMSKSAKGTVEDPGRNVRQKTGPNRGIPKSNRGLLECQQAYHAEER